MIFQTNIVYDSGMPHITTRIPNRSHWMKNLRNLKLKSENATLLLSVPAPTPAASGSGSLSDVGGALAVVSERAPGNGPHQVQRGNAQGLASKQARRQHHVRHHAKRALDATPHQHTTPTTRKPAHAPGDATTTPAAADVRRAVLQGSDQNRHGDHRQIVLFSSSCSRKTTRSSRKPRSGGRRSAMKS